jgi:hypothetical protein
MKQFPTYPGDSFHRVAKEALEEAPCWFDFNGVRVEVNDSMKEFKEEAKQFLYEYYRAALSKDPVPIWQRQVEKACKQCGKKNFITDKKCWWCETLNPCT